MNITNVSSSVIDLYNEMEKLETNEKLKFVIYIIERMNNGQINEKNELNNLNIDEDYEIFNFETFGLTHGHGENMIASLLSHLKDNKLILMNNYVSGINYDEIITVISMFEKMNYLDKIDVIKELMIRYDNNTLVNDNLVFMSISQEYSGFDIAINIEKYKKSLNISNK